MAERKADPPFEPLDVEINLDSPLDVDALFENEIDEETEAALAEEFHGKLKGKSNQRMDWF